MKASGLFSVCLVATLVSAYPAHAQTRDSHVVDRTAIERTMATKVATDQEQRETVLRVLSRPETQTVADRLGISMTQMVSAVSTMDAKDLASIAEPAARADAAYVGGDVVVLSVTALLLILIIVILLAK